MCGAVKSVAEDNLQWNEKECHREKIKINARLSALIKEKGNLPAIKNVLVDRFMKLTSL